MNTMISPAARQAIAVGRENHWRFRVLGREDLPTTPVYKSGRWFETLPEAPVIAQDRLSALKMAGVQIEGVVIAHEAPQLLGNPKPKSTLDSTTRPILSELRNVAGILGKLLLVVAQVIGILAAAVPILLFSAILVDPAVIVILKDGTWLEILTYYE